MMISKRRVSLVCILLLSMSLFFTVIELPVVEATATQQTLVFLTYRPLHSFSRQTFKAEGRWWVGLYANSKFYFTSSVNRVTWATPTLIGTAESNYDGGLWYNGTHVAYVRIPSANDKVYFRQGVPQSDGTIVWDDVEQEVATGNANDFYMCSITLDNQGYAWIICNYSVGVGGGNPRVWRNDNLDGTWATTAGFPYQPIADSQEYQGVISPMEGNQTMIFYGSTFSGGNFYSRLFNGTGWENQLTVATDFQTSFASISIEDTNDIWVVWRAWSFETYDRIEGRKWLGSSWDAKVTLYDAPTTEVMYTDVGIGYEVSSNDFHVYYRNFVTKDFHRIIYSNASGTWGSSALYCQNTLSYGSYLIEVSPAIHDYDEEFGLVHRRAWNDGGWLFGAYFVSEFPSSILEVTLSTPTDGATVYDKTVSFVFTPTWYDEDNVQNASLHVTDSWATSHWNTTSLSNATLNTIQYTVPDYATYTWNVQLFNTTSSVWASSSYTLIVEESTSPTIPPIVDSTTYPADWYFRSDTHTIHETLAYRLSIVQSDTLVEDSRVDAGAATVSYGMRLYTLDYDGTVHEVTGGSPEAIVTRTVDGDGLQSVAWTCPAYPYVIDSVKVMVYQRFDSDAWSLRRIYMTKPEMLIRFPASEWTFYYYSNRTTASTTGYFKFGDLSHLSRIAMYYQDVSPWEKQMYWIFKGDLLAFFVVPWTHTIGELFYGLVVLFMAVTTYNRYQSIRSVMVIAWLFGGVGSFLPAMLPVAGLGLANLVLALAVAITLYKLFR